MNRKGNFDMHSHLRTLLALSILASGAIACSAADAPPMIGDLDAAPPEAQASDAGPCSSPAPGCPCDQVGAQVACGTIYRVSGTHVDCSEGYYTCQDDGGWSACVGPSIFDGN